MKKLFVLCMAFAFTVTSNAQLGQTCSVAIVVAANNVCVPSPYATQNVDMWFQFLATSKRVQIIVTSPDPYGTPVSVSGVSGPHIHKVSLLGGSCMSLTELESERLALVSGANEIVLDASGLSIGSIYYIRVSRSAAGMLCTPIAIDPVGGDVCVPNTAAAFTLCVRSINMLEVTIPVDMNAEPPSPAHTYYQNRGQVADVNGNPRFDLSAYTNHTYPAVYLSDTAASFVFSHIDTVASTTDTIQRVDMQLVGMAPGVRPFKTEKTDDYLNYFLGHCPEGVTSVKGYSRTIYKDVYPFINLQFYSNNMGTKFYFVVRPGGNPNAIVLNFKGADAVKITPAGGLEIITAMHDTLRLEAHAFQPDSAGTGHLPVWPISKFTLLPSIPPTKPTLVALELQNDTFYFNRDLIIQVDRGHTTPQQSTNLVWSTYYGGNGLDAFRDVTTDAVGNIYTSGQAGSSNFPNTSGGFQTNLSGSTDAVAVKFADTGNPIWATYYGGLDYELAHGVGVDASQNVYFTGYTKSTNFPIMNAAQTTLNGTNSGPDGDVFVVSLSSGGNLQNWATYYGGTNGGTGNREVGYDLVVDGLNNVYVIGGHDLVTATPTIPTFNLAGAYNSTVGTGFILKFSSTGSKLWATRIGGTPSPTSSTALYSCAVDIVNNFYVTGQARESGYPVLNAGGSSSYNTDPANTIDAVATKFDVNGAIVWSTYYGNKGDEAGTSIAVNKSNAYITGWTHSPTTHPIQLTNPGWPAYFQSTCIGCSSWKSGFIAEFDQTGARLWGTYFKANGSINGDVAGTSLAIDSNDDIFLIGYVGGDNLPLPSPNATNTYVQDTSKGNKDLFIATFNSYIYKWGTYFGGTNDDALGVFTPSAATFKSDFLYVAGLTQSYDFPTANAYQPSAASTPDAFLSQFDLAPVLIASVSENNISDDGITVFPNPASENITLSFELKEKENVEITLNNLLGEKLYSEILKDQSGPKQKQISLSGLPTGIYILKINIDDKIIGKKIIKQYR